MYLSATQAAFGCATDTLILSCPVNRTILVTKAEYGEYSQTCGSSCCSPHPYDCTELMENGDAAEWARLKVLCDNETDCSYQFHGTTFVTACSIAEYVDYVSIYYTCLPGRKLVYA